MVAEERQLELDALLQSGGRKRVYKLRSSMDDVVEAAYQYVSGKMTIEEAAESYGVKKGSINGYLAKRREELGIEKRKRAVKSNGDTSESDSDGEIDTTSSSRKRASARSI